MTTKRIRCTCGRVYDPVKRKECPDCGAPHGAAEEGKPLTDPKKDDRSLTDTPRPSPAPVPRPPISLNPRFLAIGAGVFLLLIFIIALSRCGKPKSGTDHGEPQPTATATAIAALTPLPTVAPPPPTAPPLSTITPPPNGGAPFGLTIDLVAALADAAPGATIKIPPGAYPGGLIVNKAVHLVGTGGPAYIQSEGRECLTVRAPGVVVQNVQFACNGIGELPAISVANGADLQMEGCKVQTTTAVGVSLAGNASIKTIGSGFSANNGTAVRLTNAAHGSFTQSTFSDSQIGLWLQENAAADLHSCAFDRDGGSDNKGSIIALSSGKNSLTADDCHFTNNTSGVGALDGATLTITNSTFTDNGVTPRGNFAMGLVSLEAGAHGTLNGDVFERNQQGTIASNGSTLEINNCLFSGDGVRRQMREVLPTCQPVVVEGKGAVATIRQSKILDSAQYGANVFKGGKLIVEDVEISGTRGAGLVVGDRSAGGATAEIRRVRFTHNGTGLGIFAASSATVEECEFTENQDGIIVLDKETRLRGRKLRFTANTDAALFVRENAAATVADCDFVNNARGAIAGVKNRPAERGALTLEDCRFSGQRIFSIGACAQSEVILTRCTFDGTEKQNIYKEHSAIVQTEVPATPTPTPTPTTSPNEQTSPALESTAEPSASATPTPTRSSRRPQHSRRPPESDAERVLRHIFGPPN